MGTEIFSTEDQQELTRHETTIKTGLRNFIEVGFALCQIKEKELYKIKEHETFEDYLREMWDIGKRHANRLIAASSVVENLSETPGSRKPETEKQARALAKLPAEEQAPAWQKAVETAPDGKITARHVEKTVREIIGDPVGDGLKKTLKRVNKETIIDDDFRDAFNDFIGAIQNARAAKWKTTSKEAIIRALRSVLALLEGEAQNV